MERCERFEALLSQRLDQPLPPQEERELEDHLARCPRCRALAEDAVQGLAKETDCIFLMRRQIQDIAVQLSRLEGYVPPSED